MAKPVSLGDYVWLGARALILPGVEMSEGAVAGAGTVVSRAVAPYETVAGVPARKIGDRSRGLRYSASSLPLFNTDVKLE